MRSPGADDVIGNDSYLDRSNPCSPGKQVIRSSMGKEVERAKKAIELAQSHRVAIVSGGMRVYTAWPVSSLRCSNIQAR